MPLPLLSALLLVASSVVFAQSTNSIAHLAAERARSAYHGARERFRSETNSGEVAWHFGRACFDWADFASNNTQRAEIAQQGIAACRHAIVQNSKLAPAQYYLGLNLGQLARTKRLSALQLLDEMEAALKAAIALDPTYDYAGAHRSLGLLYQDAPGWPISIGSRSKAREHLETAVRLSPEYPDNRLALLEHYLGSGQRKKATADLSRTDSALREARKKFPGEQWALSWQDWDLRWKNINAQLASKPAETPKRKD